MPGFAPIAAWPLAAFGELAEREAKATGTIGIGGESAGLSANDAQALGSAPALAGLTAAAALSTATATGGIAVGGSARVDITPSAQVSAALVLVGTGAATTALRGQVARVVQISGLSAAALANRAHATGALAWAASILGATGQKAEAEGVLALAGLAATSTGSVGQAASQVSVTGSGSIAGPVDAAGDGPLPLDGTARAPAASRVDASGQVTLPATSAGQISAVASAFGEAAFTGQSVSAVPVQAFAASALDLVSAAESAGLIEANTGRIIDFDGVVTGSARNHAAGVGLIEIAPLISGIIGGTGFVAGTLPLAGLGLAEPATLGAATGDIVLGGLAAAGSASAAQLDSALTFGGSGIGRAEVAARAEPLVSLAGSSFGIALEARVATVAGAIALTGACIGRADLLIGGASSVTLVSLADAQAVIVARADQVAFGLGGMAAAQRPGFAEVQLSIPIFSFADGSVPLGGTAAGVLDLDAESVARTDVLALAHSVLEFGRDGSGDVVIDGDLARGIEFGLVAAGSGPVTSRMAPLFGVVGAAAGHVAQAARADSALALDADALARPHVVAVSAGGMTLAGQTTGMSTAAAVAAQMLSLSGATEARCLLNAGAAGFLALPGDAWGNAALASSAASVIALGLDTAAVTTVAALSASVVRLDLEPITTIGQIAGSIADGRFGLGAEIIALRAPPSARRLAPPGSAPGTDQGGRVAGNLRSGTVLAEPEGALAPSRRSGVIQTAARSGRVLKG